MAILLTAQLWQDLPALINVPDEDPMVHVRYYLPDAAAVWYAVAGATLAGDYYFWGLYLGPYGKSWRYFTLSELEATCGPEGEHVVRDEEFEAKPLKEIQEITDTQYECF